ncbi:MAG TPA: hypothetical protein VJ770_15755 [Stellaceae bacterium]|nr:hypothetical protein [Stellaceae bacterium]
MFADNRSSTRIAPVNRPAAARQQQQLSDSEKVLLPRTCRPSFRRATLFAQTPITRAKAACDSRKRARASDTYSDAIIVVMVV